MSKAGGRRLGGVVLGMLLATLVAWSPVAVQPALAAGPLRIEADTTYTVDPGDATVHVAVAYRITNNKPNTPTIIYFYRTLNLGIQAEARSVRATDGSGGLSVATTRHRNYTEVDVRLRANLYYQRTARFTLRYDLPGGAPRSTSPTRVSEAFVTFGVWAFGDRNLGTVEVRMPPGFNTTIDGGPMTTRNSTAGNVLTAAPASPDRFYAVITGENTSRYDRERLELEGGVVIAVLSWPEDDRWADAVTDTLEAGMPRLQELVGLDWPVDDVLNVRERYTPSLEGYAGFFLADEDRIDVTENLDPVTIMHEASHAWFNEDLFSYRWIYEGLAEEYSYRVQLAVGGKTDGPPREPKANAAGKVALNTWAFPSVIRDETSDTELYGYGASFWLLHQIVETAGEEQMRQAFAGAAGNLTAYPGEGQAETVGQVDDWRRLLDLTQPLDEPDPADVLDAMGDYVLGGLSATEMSDRLHAREAYRQLVAAGDGWAPPWYIREAMGKWLFRDAMPRMEVATTVLALRDELEAAAAAEGLPLGDELEKAYESAQSSFDGATTLAASQLAAIEAIADARATVQVEPDLVGQLGLLGGTPPAVPYAAARTAFENGDFALALQEAQSAAAIAAGAAALGQERIVLGAIVLVALVALLLFVVLVRRRRSRRPLGVEPGSSAFLALDAGFAPAAAPDVAPGSTAAPGGPEPVEPSGTLGADPNVPPPPPGGSPPDADGGMTHT
jgi:hypothetical protein